MAGEYTDLSGSWNENKLSGIGDWIGTKREEHRKVVLPSDLAALREKQQAMLILGGRYAGLCRASRYYEDPEMARLAADFKQKALICRRVVPAQEITEMPVQLVLIGCIKCLQYSMI